MNIIIFHGTDCKPTDYWYLWLAEQLRKSGHMAEVPSLVRINQEPLDDTLTQVFAKFPPESFDENTILVGHSAGAPLILSILEKVNQPIKRAILVSGYSTRYDEAPDPVLQSLYDFAKIKQNCRDFIFINSTDDPWGCDDKQGRILFDNLGGTQIIKKEGHFGSTSYNQPYKKFPLLLELVEMESK